MPDTSHDWISSATRPFQDNPEFQHAARHDLAERGATADPDQLAALVDRFDIIDRVPAVTRNRLYWLPVALAAAIALLIGIPTALNYLALRDFLTSMTVGTSGGSKANPTDRMQAQLTSEQRLYVFGDTRQPTRELAAKALWDTQPDNPVLFADYLGYCDPLPDDLLETARRIDPDNAWFLLIAAGQLAEEAVEKHKRPWSGPREDRPKRSDWTIKDKEKFKDALALIEEAVAKPRLEYYNSDLLKERLAILPPEHDFPTRIARLTFAAGTSSVTIFDLLNASNIISTRAFILGTNKDADALRALIPTADSLCRQLAQQDGTLVVQLVNLAVCVSIHEHLVEACEQCDLTAEANHLRTTLDSLHLVRDKESGWSDEESVRIKKHGDMLAALAIPIIGKFGVPPVPLEDLEAGRKMNYTLADRALLWGFVIHLLVAVGIALVLPRFRGTLSFRIGRRFAALPDRIDWVWILGLGTIAPLAWFMTISHLTPLGCRDWGLGFFLFQPLAGQYALTLYLLIFANLAVTRWRVGRRASSLGFATRHPRLGLVPVLLLALAIPLAGLIRFGTATGLNFAVVALTIGNLWALFLAGRALFGKPQHAPYRAAVATILAPAMALAALILLAIIPLTHRAERHWIAQDDLMRTSPENYGMSRTEREACELVQSKIQTALNNR